MSRALELARAHLAAEDVQDIAATLATFTDDCFYRIPALGIELRGKNAIGDYYRALFAAFPVFTNTAERWYDSGDSAFVELTVERTHLGQWGPFAPTGRRLRTTSLAHFPLAPDGLLRAEIVYLNPAEALHQLGALPSMDLFAVAEELARLRRAVEEPGRGGA